MDQSENSQELISALKTLYGKLSLHIAKIRSHSYVSNSPSNKPIDISSVLTKQIQAYSISYNKRNFQQDTAFTEPATTVTLHHSDTQTSDETTSSGEADEESELTRVLKQIKYFSITQPHVGDNLKESTLEHIHAALRSARLGKPNKAKLHANIAANALEVAGHFMCEDDYLELIALVEQYIDDKL